MEEYAFIPVLSLEGAGGSVITVVLPKARWCHSGWKKARVCEMSSLVTDARLQHYTGQLIHNTFSSHSTREWKPNIRFGHVLGKSLLAYQVLISHC